MTNGDGDALLVRGCRSITPSTLIVGRDLSTNMELDLIQGSSFELDAWLQLRIGDWFSLFVDQNATHDPTIIEFNRMLRGWCMRVLGTPFTPIGRITLSFDKDREILQLFWHPQDNSTFFVRSNSQPSGTLLGLLTDL